MLSNSLFKVTGYRRVGVAYVKTFKLSLRVSIVQNLQSYAFSSLYGQLYLQESARLNFTHTQREIASSLSIFCTRFKNLGTPFATTFLTYKALKDGRGIDRASFAQLYSGAKKNRKN